MGPPTILQEWPLTALSVKDVIAESSRQGSPPKFGEKLPIGNGKRNHSNNIRLRLYILALGHIWPGSGNCALAPSAAHEARQLSGRGYSPAWPTENCRCKTRAFAELAGLKPIPVSGISVWQRARSREEAHEEQADRFEPIRPEEASMRCRLIARICFSGACRQELLLQ